MLELNRIHLVDVVDGIKHVDDGSCQIIIADAPYNVGKNFGNNSDRRSLGEYLEWCDRWIAECVRVLKDDGSMFIFGFSEILAYVFVRIELKKRWLVWHYVNKNMPYRSFWQRSHESIICCWKSKPVFNCDAVREPYTEGFLRNKTGKVRGGKTGKLAKNGVPTIFVAHPKGALPRDVIRVPTLAGGGGRGERWFLCKTCGRVCRPETIDDHYDHVVIKHPTQKPLALCDKLIASARQDSGIVLVPFAGVGSECVSARKHGLDFIGFEINEDYIRIANERLSEFAMQLF